MNYKEETRKSYDKHVEYCDSYFKGLFDLEKRTEFKQFIELLSGKDIFDLGCGSGDHALYFKKQGLHVKCIDISEKMIELCKRKGLDAQVMDIENLKFDDNSFDGIWAVTSLLHVPKKKISKVIDKLSRILKPQGPFYVCVKEGTSEGMVVDGNDPTTKRFFAYWQKNEFLEIFNKHFTLVKFWRIKVKDRIFLQAFFRNKKSS